MRSNGFFYASLLSLSVGLYIAPLPARADLNEGDYTYTVTGDQATITGFNSEYSGALAITNYLGGYPVTSIGDWAFGFCDSLTSVTIPGSVTTIGIAFYGCDGLIDVTIPDSVIRIDLDAFYECFSLTEINVAEQNAAYSSANGVLFNQNKTDLIQCPAGKTGSITIPDSVTSIGARAFEQCVGLTNLTLSAIVTNIGDRAFFNCTGLSNLTIPDSVTAIGGSAFDSCTGLTNVTLSANVTSLGPYAFCNCVSLTGVILPDSVISIEEGVFSDCSSLTSVTLPGNVTTVGEYSFAACANLTGVYFLGDAPSPDPDPNVFEGSPNATVYCLPNTAGWGSSFGGCLTALWVPRALSDDNFGLHTDHFGFTISWVSDRTVIVEASTNLTSTLWTPLLTQNLGTSGSFYFSDPSAASYPTRFYRLVWP